ncbi:MAG TPA: MlaD family protein [Candidatus Binataceae bacterium]
MDLTMLKSAAVILTVAGSMWLGGCASAAPSRFTTQLDTTGGIGPGDPVTHVGATIGRVTGVAPLSAGDSEIAFEVDHSHAGEIRQDTLMVLGSQDGAPALDAFNSEAMSPAAPSGFPLDGASSQTEVQLFLAARGPGSYGQMIADLLKPLNAPSAPPSPAEAQMQSLFNQLSQRTMAAAAASSPATQAQLDQTRREAQGVIRQLRRNGNSAQADRLQQQVDTTLSGVGTPANTLTIPRPNPAGP